MGLSRSEFFARIGILREIDPLTDLAYRFDEQQTARQSDQGAADAEKWHTRFHGSQFPGDDERACPRQALYRMLDIPRNTGSYLHSNRKLTQIADAGKDIEDRLTMNWHRAGYLLSTPPFDPFGNRQMQDQFEDSDAWLTSTVDAIVLWPRSVMPVVAEVKSKSAEVVADMKRLIRGPDAKHVKQVKTQIAMAKHDFEINPRTVLRCYNTDRLAIPQVLYQLDDNGKNASAGIKAVVGTVCPQHLTNECLYECELEPPSYGFLYYVSRDNPADTFEFYFDYDPKFYEAGIAALKRWQQFFKDDVLPQTNFVEKRYAHPFGWKWGEHPCKWCDFGDACRDDNKRAIKQQKPIKLSESVAILDAKAVRPDYDFDAVRESVFERWGVSPVPA